MIAVQAVRQLLRRLRNWLMLRRRAVHGAQTGRVHTTDFCVMPSFMSGVARLYDLWGEPSSPIKFAETQHADWAALDADCQAVASDFQRATNLVLEQQDPPIDQDELNASVKQLPLNRAP